jgi:dTDP-4-amino-4,6-dideoxygalactose transaminase
MKYISNERILNLSSDRHDNAPWSKEEKVKYYASGREAIISLIDGLNSTKQVVLLPAYVPQGLYAPFEKRDWKILLYPIDKNLTPVWSEVNRLIEEFSPTFAVLIHYFGIEQSIDKFIDISHKHGVKVIEDNTHLISLEKKKNPNVDYILYSLPKMIGVPDGAVLVVNDKSMPLESLTYHRHRSNRLYLFKQYFSLFLLRAIIKIPSAKFVNLTLAFFGKFLNSYSSLMKNYHMPNAMSSFSKKVMIHTDFNMLIKKRSWYARIYEERLDNKVFKRVLQMGTLNRATFGYVVLVKNRDSLYRYLAKYGIYGTYLANGWDYIPTEEREKPYFKDTFYIVNNNFIFPTGFHLDENDINSIVKYANIWAKEQSSNSITTS